MTNLMHRTGNAEQLRARSLRNVDNRGIHTTVWDLELVKQVSNVLNCEVIYQSVEGIHQWSVLRKLEEQGCLYKTYLERMM